MIKVQRIFYSNDKTAFFTATTPKTINTKKRALDVSYLSYTHLDHIIHTDKIHDTFSTVVSQALGPQAKPRAYYYCTGLVSVISKRPRPTQQAQIKNENAQNHCCYSCVHQGCCFVRNFTSCETHSNTHKEGNIYSMTKKKNEIIKIILTIPDPTPHTRPSLRCCETA